MEPFVDAAQLAPVLTAATARLLRKSSSPNTRRAYASRLRRLDVWLDGRALDDATLAEYVGWLHQTGFAAATASQALAACKHQARMSGDSNPAGPLTERAMAGFRRDGGARKRGRGQALGITAPEAARMAAVAGRGASSIRGLRDGALITVMSDAMLRVSEVAGLRVEDVTVAGDGSGRLTVHQSKTDVAGEGAALYLGPPAMSRWRDWLTAAQIEDGLAFRRIRRGGHVQTGGLTPNTVRLIIQKRAAAAGIAGGRITGHSLRVGMAQTLAAAGASLVELQVAGRWKSPQMPALYARGERAGRNAVARLIYAHQTRNGSGNE